MGAGAGPTDQLQQQTCSLYQTHTICRANACLEDHKLPVQGFLAPQHCSWCSLMAIMNSPQNFNLQHTAYLRLCIFVVAWPTSIPVQAALDTLCIWQYIRAVLRET